MSSRMDSSHIQKLKGFPGMFSWSNDGITEDTFISVASAGASAGSAMQDEPLAGVSPTLANFDQDT